ncbi:aldose 1-epimerase [Palleronia aestuarii]|uniref:Aldose 1-epimerase n=1 Tax=Palleronia aestuarii TaxID=568105 RepID=A0A2W7NFQ9_9RHOB|nr:aldose epimerase family protein [Palleronia aestuarii]PZX10132.1 aldose 1-epimerase [Palleronia aestuarii]
MDKFGTLSDGREVGRLVLDNGALQVALLDLGALIQDVRLPGIAFPLTLGGASAEAYEGILSHFGAVLGPVANRIRGAEAVIDGRTYRFDANQDGRHTLHSGSTGVHRRIWRLVGASDIHAIFEIDLADGDGGFPGNRRLTARYELNETTLIVTLTGETDAPTLMSLASHGYWSVMDEPDWRGQRLQILSERYLPTDADDIPTGAIRDVAGTPYDFRTPRDLQGDDIPPLDNNFCLSDRAMPLRPAIRLGGNSGVELEISTTAPGVQVFDMNKFDVTAATIHGRSYRRYAALAFEPQMWPDAPGRPGWPDITLHPGSIFSQVSAYRFLRDD